MRWGGTLFNFPSQNFHCNPLHCMILPAVKVILGLRRGISASQRPPVGMAAVEITDASVIYKPLSYSHPLAASCDQPRPPPAGIAHFAALQHPTFPPIDRSYRSKSLH